MSVAAINPATGESLEPLQPTDLSKLETIVGECREAQKDWARRTLDDRISVVRGVGQRILERREEIAGILSDETGRSVTECMMSELVGTADFVEGAVRVARRALASERVRLSKLNYPGKAAVVEAVPRGVVAIIAPWNYPLGNFFKHMFPALLAGNGLVFKPSEHTPRSGAWLARIVNDVVGASLVGLVQGAGEAGARLLDAGVDAVTFTGSVATGRKVAAAAGERLIPCTVELGGKDAALVLADCDLERTVAGIAQWTFHNAGQDCSSIERIYVESSIHDLFVRRLKRFAEKLKVAPAGSGVSDLGPLQNEQQLEIVAAHVKDAVDQGAKIECGGTRTGQGYGFEPTVLTGCTDDMRIMQEETFGPVAAVARVEDTAEGVRRANAVPFGLNASVWTKNIRRGETVARQLDAGIVLVNNHSICGIIPEVPWTGVKQTGSGVANSAHAYHTYVRRRTVFVDRSKAPDPWWKPATAELRDFADALIQKGRGSFGVIFKLAGLVGKRTKSIREAVQSTDDP